MPRTKVPPIKENVITVKYLMDGNDAVKMFIIYRTENTPKAAQPDPLNPITDPVEFKIIDKKSKVIEKDVADTLGKALDYGRAWAQKHELQFSDSP